MPCSKQCKPPAAPCARTHGSEDVAGDAVPSQLQLPQGSVAGETVYQGAAPQEADVIPAQVWREIWCCQMESTGRGWEGWPSLEHWYSL